MSVFVRHLVLALSLAFSSPLLATEKHRIGFFIPDDTPFWSRVVLFARAAANDLGVEIQVFDADANRVLMAKQIMQASSGDEHYDALIFPNFISVAASAIKICEKYKVPCFLYNSDLSDTNKRFFGIPGEKYRYWIAQLIPDDVGSSALLAESLIELSEARKSLPKIVAINGYRSDAPAIKREAGLRSVIEKKETIKFHQLVYTDWGVEEAYDRTKGLMRRYGDINVIWSANYRTTTGILKALEEEGKIPGKDVLLNSYDIDPNSLQHIENGLVSVTAGGHYVEGAWSVIMAYDFLKGVKLNADQRILNTPMMIVTANNLALVKQALVQLEESPESLEKADFSKFSLLNNDKLDDYQFSLESILEEILN